MSQNQTRTEMLGIQPHELLNEYVKGLPVEGPLKGLYHNLISPMDTKRRDRVREFLSKDKLAMEHCYKNCSNFENNFHREYCIRKRCNLE